ncbi:MAG TPA: hypothetical protein VFG15_06285 [Amycolatopsis sp.]|nr:hypothetical protein [Amycolatopsis sp.]
MLKTFAALLKPAATRLSWVVLSVIGLVLLVIAGWTLGLFWGLIATGIACFLLELRIDFEKREREAADGDHG